MTRDDAIRWAAYGGRRWSKWHRLRHPGGTVPFCGRVPTSARCQRARWDDVRRQRCLFEPLACRRCGSLDTSRR